MATSPSDQNNQNVLAWLERLEDSVRTAGRYPTTFSLESRSTEESAENESELESDGEQGEQTERGSIGTDGTVKVEEDETLHSLPDAAVPLGLIAKLSLDSSSSSKKKTSVSAKDGDETDDDNVVSASWFAASDYSSCV